MDLQFSVEEMNDLLRKAKRSASAVRTQEQESKVGQLDLRNSGKLSGEQIQIISTLHETLAERAGKALSALTQKTVQMTLDSVELGTYGAFLKGMIDPTYMASVVVPSPDSRLIFQADVSLVFPFVDIILGGTGTDPAETRDLTQIEEELFESVGEILCREMQSTWRTMVDIKFQFERRQKIDSSAALMPQGDRVICLTFSLHLQEMEGKMRLIIPSAVSDALLAKMIVQIPSAEPVPTSHKDQSRMRERLLDSRFPAELMLPISKVSVREVFNLKPGAVLVLETRATEPIQVNIAEKNMFLAVPVRFGSMRGAQIQQILSIAPKERKDRK